MSPARLPPHLRTFVLVLLLAPVSPHRGALVQWPSRASGRLQLWQARRAAPRGRRAWSSSRCLGGSREGGAGAFREARAAGGSQFEALPSGAALACALALAASAVVPAALATDRSVAPPTCPSASTARGFGCSPRRGDGALAEAEEQLRLARERLQEAEASSNAVLAPGDLDPSSPFVGRPEALEFWRDEVARLRMNMDYLEGVRSQLATGRRASGDGRAATAPLRLVARLAILAEDVAQEARFWCEAVGMQRYGDLPGGGVVVAYGPPGFARGDEGGFFAIEIRPTGGLTASTPRASPPGGTRLSFVQIAIPTQLRSFKISETGGQLLNGYGFFELRSPAGVIIRAYIDDRRDPVEFVALTAEDKMAAGQRLEAVGLRPRGQYKLTSPLTQENMPRLPPDNALYAGGDPQKSVQVLLLPLTEGGGPSEAEGKEDGPRRAPEARDSSAEVVSRPLYQAVLDDLAGRPSRGEEPEAMERPYTPLSSAQGSCLVVFGEPGAVEEAPPRRAADSTPASARGGGTSARASSAPQMAVELRSVKGAG